MSPGDEDAVVVWRVGEALLAAPLADTAEIAAVSRDGRAVSRSGRLELRTPPGLPPPDRPRRAVVLRAGAGPLAMAADEVEGVRSVGERRAAATPPWIRTVEAGYLAGLILLDDERIAALLAIEALAGP